MLEPTLQHSRNAISENNNNHYILVLIDLNLFIILKLDNNISRLLQSSLSHERYL